MPRLSPAPPAEVIRKLRRLGFEGPFTGGRHLVMRHLQTRVKISIPTHPGRDIPRGTLRAILRAAGVTIEEWANL